MKLLAVSFLFLFSSFSAFSAEDPRITTGKIAELAVHRIDRLVTLKKIDPQFLNRLETIDVTKPQGTPEAYRAVVSQTTPASGAPLQLTLTFDANGKFISFTPVEGGTAGADPAWSPKDPATLMENAMHFVLENTAKQEIEPYFLSMTRATLGKTIYREESVAVVKFSTSAQAQTLNVYLKMDGKFITHTIE